MLQRFLFVLLLMFLGFCAGMYLGSFFVAPGSGLSGTTVALGYGLAGFIIFMITGVLLARTLKPSQLRNALIIVSILSLIMCGWIVYRIKLIKNQQNKAAKLVSPSTGKKIIFL